MSDHVYKSVEITGSSPEVVEFRGAREVREVDRALTESRALHSGQALRVFGEVRRVEHPWRGQLEIAARRFDQLADIARMLAGREVIGDADTGVRLAQR